MSEYNKLEKEILECLARAYTYVANEKKEIDIVLIGAMAEELTALFDKDLPETVVLKFNNFPKHKSKISDLLNELLK